MSVDLLERATAHTATVTILGVKIAATTYSAFSQAIVKRAKAHSAAYICVANVHTVMEAHDDPEFRTVMNEADAAVPDGMPLVWALRTLGKGSASRVYGPDLMPIVLSEALNAGIAVGLYGGSEKTLARLRDVILRQFPGLTIAYCFSPPFRTLTREEDEIVVNEINRSGARILFVGLGAPKQEYWMAAHRDSVNAVMIGVGAAFDFLAGTKRQAPRWMMRIGMEWCFRLITEPRRLWKRYLKHNPRFVALFVLQLVGFSDFNSDAV